MNRWRPGLLTERDRLESEVEELQRRHVLGLPVELAKALELGAELARLTARVASYIEDVEHRAQTRCGYLESEVERLGRKIEQLENAKAPA